MAVLSGATASGRQLYGGTLTTTANTVVYSSPANNANVTAPSSTAYIKEIVICNASSSPVTVSLSVNGIPIISGLSINGNDAKVLFGLNTMIPAGASVWAWANTPSAVGCTISGVEIQ